MVMPVTSLSSYPAFQPFPRMSPPKDFYQGQKPDIQHLLTAGGLFSLGLLLHRLPAVKSSFKYVSSDWKDWAKMALGIASVGQVNQALDWKPPVWLGALETTAIVNPLIAGFSQKTALQTVVMSPLIAGMVLGANYLNDQVATPLQDEYQIPPVLTRMGITLAMMAVGVKAYPKIYWQVATTGILGKEARKNATYAMLGTQAIICSRCGSNHLICISEIGDYLGSLGNWFRSRFSEKKVS